jgi:hypothetical protein
MLLINLFAALVQLVQTALTLYQILHPQPVRSSWFGSILVSGMLVLRRRFGLHTSGLLPDPG